MTTLKTRLIKPGVRFDTEYEENCIVTGAVDSEGNFLALDSDGMERLFSLRMVAAVWGPEN